MAAPIISTVAMLRLLLGIQLTSAQFVFFDKANVPIPFSFSVYQRLHIQVDASPKIIHLNNFSIAAKTDGLLPPPSFRDLLHYSQVVVAVIPEIHGQGIYAHMPCPLPPSQDSVAEDSKYIWMRLSLHEQHFDFEVHVSGRYVFVAVNCGGSGAIEMSGDIAVQNSWGHLSPLDAPKLYSYALICSMWFGISATLVMLNRKRLQATTLSEKVLLAVSVAAMADSACTWQRLWAINRGIFMTSWMYCADLLRFWKYLGLWQIFLLDPFHGIRFNDGGTWFTIVLLSLSTIAVQELSKLAIRRRTQDVLFTYAKGPIIIALILNVSVTLVGFLKLGKWIRRLEKSKDEWHVNTLVVYRRLLTLFVIAKVGFFYCETLVVLDPTLADPANWVYHAVVDGLPEFFLMLVFCSASRAFQFD